MTDTKLITVKVDHETLEQLDELTAIYNNRNLGRVTRSDVIRHLIEQEYQRQKRLETDRSRPR